MTDSDVGTVLVAGASGATGRWILRLLGPRGPTVRALTRSPDDRGRLLGAGADDVVVEDLLAPSDLAGALDGVDAVLSAVGSSPREVYRGGPFVDGAGNRALFEAAAETGVDSVVMESALGVGSDDASPLATAFDLFIGPVQRAKADAEAVLRDAAVRHTIFRPGILTDGRRTDDVTVAPPGARLWGTVSRADVARLMVAAPTTGPAADRTFEVVSRPSFRDRGLGVEWRLPE